MKKKNKYNRRANALKRLELQVKERSPSAEFVASLTEMNKAAIEEATIQYWDKKDKELLNLKKKLV